MRDIIFYIIALIILLTSSFVGEINLFYGISFLVLYLVYVVYVVIQDKLDEKTKQKHLEIRQTIETKRATYVKLSTNEENLLDLASAEDDAYLVYKNDHLVKVEFENEDNEDSQM